MITLEPYELRKILSDAVELGVNTALEKSGIIKPYLSKRQADKLYGRRIVERWILEGLIKPTKDSSQTSTIRILRSEIEKVASQCNWATYLDTIERCQKQIEKKQLSQNVNASKKTNPQIENCNSHDPHRK